MLVPGNKKVGQCLPRTPGYATTEGPEYEFKMAALVVLRARAKGLKFRLCSNARAAHPFDDLVQLKQSVNKGFVYFKDFVAGKGNFSLPEYFPLFENPLELSKRQCPKPTEEERELLQEVGQPHTTLVLCTNKEVVRQSEGQVRAQDATMEDLFLHNAPGAAPSSLLF